MEMDSNYKFPGSPGTPLFTVSPERVNQQRPPIYEGSPTATVRSHHARDSSVTDKVAVFNSLAFQGKQLERKANDAALKRAMLGREEAESEMRRYREETRSLRRQLDEGRERERRVGERLESVMVWVSTRSVVFMGLTKFAGKLWTGERDIRPYTNAMGEGDSTSPQGELQITIIRGEATGRVKVCAEYDENR